MKLSWRAVNRSEYSIRDLRKPSAFQRIKIIMKTILIYLFRRGVSSRIMEFVRISHLSALSNFLQERISELTRLSSQGRMSVLFTTRECRRHFSDLQNYFRLGPPATKQFPDVIRLGCNEIGQSIPRIWSNGASQIDAGLCIL